MENARKIYGQEDIQIFGKNQLNNGLCGTHEKEVMLSNYYPPEKTKFTDERG